MNRVPLLLTVALLVFAHAPPSAADVSPDPPRLPLDAAGLDVDMIDLDSRSRFHLTTRAGLRSAEGAAAALIDDGSVWSFEAKIGVRVAKWASVNAVVPFGLDAFRTRDSKDQFFLGNLRLGFQGAVKFELGQNTETHRVPTLAIGFGLDVYAPTMSPFDKTGDCGQLLGCLPPPSFALRLIRPYEPGLYVERALSFRPRLQVGFAVDVLRANLELGLTNTYQFFRGSTEIRNWFSWKIRVAAMLAQKVEPFLSVSDSAGGGVTIENIEFSSFEPVVLTAGARIYFGGVAPALFVSYDVDNSEVFFGLDLAGVIRTESREAFGDDLDGFIP